MSRLSMFPHDVSNPYQSKSNTAKIAINFFNKFVEKFNDMHLKIINLKKDDNLLDIVISNTKKGHFIIVFRDDNPIAIFNDKLKNIPIPFELYFDGCIGIESVDRKWLGYLESKMVDDIALFGYMM